ncbi:MAG: hypothetical protein JNJ47_02685, partial [Alphaproteobacteria bacterium]|nr:hypothetical protein [Alphaproteobacteria bacterium]
MISFKVNFLKFLNSTAMTLLFLSPVSAMVPDGQDGWEDYPFLMVQPPFSGDGAPLISSPSILFNESVVDSEGWEDYSHLIGEPSSSIKFEQIEEERAATKLRSDLNLGEPQKLFLFEEDRFIKGEVPGDGTCFIHTLKMLFPDKEISRDKFAARLNSAFKGVDPTVSEQDIRREFAEELYAQLFQAKVMGGEPEFKGEEINKLFLHYLNETFSNYFDLTENGKAVQKDIAANTKIIEEMLADFSKTHVMLSLPATGLENIGSFGLACKLFGLNLDIYSPIYGQSSSLYKRQEFRFGGEAHPPQAAFYASAHVSPLCRENEISIRESF